MDASDVRTLAIVALVAVVPIAVVLLVALLRGYSIDFHMFRRRRNGDDGDDQAGT